MAKLLDYNDRWAELEAELGPAELERWIDRVLDAESLDEVFASS